MSSETKSLHKIDVLGIKINPITISELHDEMSSIIDNNQKEMILNVNVNCMNIAHNQRWLKDLLNSVRVVFCDGAGVMLGAQILGKSIPQRITYADWMWELSGFCEQKGYSMFFLGAREGIARKATQNLQRRFPKLKIVGLHHGYFKTDGNENEQVIKLVNSTKTDILVVGFGMPFQERWILENFHKINTHVFLTGGACFDFVSGMVHRGPRWMVDHGLEWLYRLVLEPKRMWQRYLIGNFIFLSRILQESFKNNMLGSSIDARLLNKKDEHEGL